MSVDLLGEARRRLDAGDPRSAYRLAERALESARASGTREAGATAAHLLGECSYAIGDIAGSRVYAEEAMRSSEALGAPALLGADLNLLGVLDITEGRLEEAVGLLRRSYDLRSDALGPDHPDTIESLNNVAVALWRSGENDEAIRLHEDALGRCERALGEDHRRTAETLNALAVKLEQRPGLERRAHELYERGLHSAEAALGPDSDLVARLLTNVATARMNTGDAESAGPFLERALVLHERHFGPSSRWTGHVLLAQGGHAHELGRLEDAPRLRASVRDLRARGRAVGARDAGGDDGADRRSRRRWHRRGAGARDGALPAARRLRPGAPCDVPGRSEPRPRTCGRDAGTSRRPAGRSHPARRRTGSRDRARGSAQRTGRHGFPRGRPRVGGGTASRGDLPARDGPRADGHVARGAVAAAPPRPSPRRHRERGAVDPAADRVHLRGELRGDPPVRHPGARRGVLAGAARVRPGGRPRDGGAHRVARARCARRGECARSVRARRHRGRA